MLQSIHRLEQILWLWEDTWFLLNAYWRACHGIGNYLYLHDEHRPVPMSGPIKHWRELRPFLSALVPNSDIYDVDRFSGPPEFRATIPDLPGGIRALPLSLAAWVNHGRRVFNVTAATQTTLESQPLPNIT